ncbi:MAG: YlmC/YmxH family sporulation protein [Clostridiales bacterium]|uniref:YlmC/YmxH family sporulation protein n=1 Tax=Clostridium sp. N3C TaxID=1776758 RepID=UPI00092DFC62|nr:YlmC/YmxH family sporulation protein [Clostridium sp. N3C]NLZ48211.1 YlmC/YmxH family sporulation protein [Clostridiales bacterium]SCN21898.1 sporulation protein, YlmC/YmxH family [Clostridium sp. N3C]
MGDNMKLYSDIEKYEIINVNDGEKYSYLANNDVIIDENGYLKLIILNKTQSRFSFFSNNEIIEVSWDCVKKIGSRTIIIDADEDLMKKTRL